MSRNRLHIHVIPYDTVFCAKVGQICFIDDILCTCERLFQCNFFIRCKIPGSFSQTACFLILQGINRSRYIILKLEKVISHNYNPPLCMEILPLFSLQLF